MPPANSRDGGLRHASKDKFQTDTEGSSLNTDVMTQDGFIGTSSLKASDGGFENWSLSVCTKCQQLSSVESWKSIKLSLEFIKISWELIKSGNVSEELNILSPLRLMKLLESFSLKDFAHLDKIRHKKAELFIPGYNAENPFTFIPGLPVGVTSEVSLCNATSKDRLWLKLSLDEFSEFVYLDKDVQDSEEVVPTKITAAFYGTPDAGDSRLRIIVGVECLSEDLSAVKHHGGPKYPLIYLSSEREVYFTLHSRGARIDI